MRTAVLVSVLCLGVALSVPLQGKDDISTVFVVQSCHLDVGFADTAANIVNRYFDHFFLDAAATAQELRQAGGEERLVFTTHSYLVSLFFDCPLGLGVHCPNETAKATVKDALHNGDIVMHAFPFNAEPEVLDASLFNASLEVTRAAASLVGVTMPTTMSQRDVPGMTQSVIPLLSANGMRAVTVGVNTASLPPAVPKAFVWKADDSSVLAMWHPHGYGGIDVEDCVTVDGWDKALAFAWKGDNQGPPSADEVKATYAQLRKEFPSAKIVAASFDDFVDQLAGVSDRLPVVEGEIGDTWIYGVPSDPYKVAAFREAMRQRTACLQDSSCDSSAASFSNFSRLLTKNSEHTWGMDVKTFLHDQTSWTNAQFQAARGGSNYATIEASWREQRLWGLDAALEALGGHALAGRLSAAWKEIRSGAMDLSDFQQIKPNEPVSLLDGQIKLQFGSDGSVIQLEVNGVALADETHPLGQLVYQTFTDGDYTDFFDEYAQRIDGKVPSYFHMDFGKPNVSEAKPMHTTDYPTLDTVHRKDDVVVATLSFPEHLVQLYGAAQQIQIAVSATSEGTVDWDVRYVNKTATRLPEATWLVFNPLTDDVHEGNWKMSKLAHLVDSGDQVVNGSRHLHGLDDGGMYKQGEKVDLSVSSVDTAVVCLGKPTPFPTPETMPDMTEGFAFAMHNNIWGTNYVMWYPFADGDESMRYRFSLALHQKNTAAMH